MENQNKKFRIREEEFKGFDKYCEYVNKNRVDNLANYVLSRHKNVSIHAENNSIKNNDYGYNYFEGMKRAFEEVLDILKIFWIEEVEVEEEKGE